MEGFYKPKLYKIKVIGHLDKNWEEWFGGMNIRYEDDNTVIEGNVVDNATLHSLLTRLGDLNLTIISLEQIRSNNQQAN